MEKSKVITLDGINSGFGIYLERKEDFIRNNMIFIPKSMKSVVGENDIKLFKNLETAKAYLNYKFKITDPHDYKIWLFVNDMEIDYDNIQYNSPYYEYYDEENIHYYIMETAVEKVTNIGYIVFEDGDEKKICDPKIGSKKSKELYGYVRQAISSIVSYPDLDVSIEKIYRDSKGFLCLKLKNSTAKIHILYNSQIMDLNMNRKAGGLKCIPFIGDMDKYKSIYIFATKDESDYLIKDIEDYIMTIINMIMEELVYYYQESNPRYVPVQFNGYVINE